MYITTATTTNIITIIPNYIIIVIIATIITIIIIIITFQGHPELGSHTAALVEEQKSACNNLMIEL